MYALPGICALISAVFAWQVWRDYRERRKPYQAVWAFALALSAAGSLAYLLSWGLGGVPLLFRLYYFCGAFCMAAYMGLGSVFLALGSRAGAWTLRVLGLATVLGGYALLARVPLDGQALAALAGGAGSGVLELSGWPLMLMILMNAFGTVSVVGVSVHSLLRSQSVPHGYISGNVLLSGGVLVLAAAGSTARLGIAGGFWLTMTVGWIIAFIGFRRIHHALQSARRAVTS